MEKEIAGLQMSDELPPGEQWASAGENSLEPIPSADKWDAEIVQVPDYRARIREVFANEGARIGRGSSFGFHLRIVLSGGGEVRDYGGKITCKSGSAEEAAATVKLAVAKGWKKLRVCGNDAYRRDVWIEGLRAGYAQDEIKGYEPSAADLALVRALSLAPPAKPTLAIKTPALPHGSDGSKQAGAELMPPASRKLRM